MRFSEAAETRWNSLISLLACESSAGISNHYALFGHSLGALVALEVAHAISAQIGRPPLWMGVSGCTAPAQREPDDAWMHKSDQEIVEKIGQLGGTSSELLQNPELLALLLPAIRADFHLAGTYVRRARDRLASPLLVLAGTKDEEVVRPPEKVTDWALEAGGPVRTVYVEGDHFFIDQQPRLVVRHIVDDLSRLFAGAIAHA